jgi:hypothetical protein
MALRKIRQFQTALKPTLACLGLLFSVSASAELFHGVAFPDGVSSFADAVFSYDPAFGGGAVPTATYQMRLRRWGLLTIRKVQTRDMSAWGLEAESS